LSSADRQTDRPTRLAVAQPLRLPDARRVAPAELARDVELVGRSPIVAALLDAVDAMLLVLNPQRQIVAVNGRAGAASAGLRPGEALACGNSRDAAAGCGASAACRMCGALGAILGCQDTQRPVDAECVLPSSTHAGTAQEFSVRASPVRIEGTTFTVVALRDISTEKRREALEQIFFHDVLNTVAGLRGWTWRLRRPDADHAAAGERVDLLARQLEREIRDHRTLILAERGELVPARARVRPGELLRDLEVIFSSHAAARQRSLAFGAAPADVELETDPALVTRVLVNMVVNALEATPEGGTVRVTCERLATGAGDDAAPAGEARFAVHNGAAMRPEVQARVFQRSFSTKAERGRGLGTYGMKLLGERYLRGRVGFTSAPETGTVFELRLPIALS
jgi:hypothetical protein